MQTSKYSVLPFRLNFFLWLNLFEQFHKAANVYFLLIAALQLVPGLSPTGRFTTLIPFMHGSVANDGQKMHWKTGDDTRVIRSSTVRGDRLAQ